MMFDEINYASQLYIRYDMPPSIKSSSHLDLFRSTKRELVHTEARIRKRGKSRIR